MNRTYDVVTILAVAIIDLDVARLGDVRGPSDIHRLPPRRNGVCLRRCLRRDRRGRGLHAAPNHYGTDVHTDIPVQVSDLLDRLRSGERDCDIVLAALTANVVETRISFVSANIRIVDRDTRGTRRTYFSCGSPRTTQSR